MPGVGCELILFGRADVRGAGAGETGEATGAAASSDPPGSGGSDGGGREQRRRKIRGGLDAEHPAERPEDPRGLGRRCQKCREFGVGQDVPDLRADSRRLMPQHFEEPAEPVRQAESSLGLCSRGPGSGGPDEDWAGAEAGDEGFEAPGHSAEVVVEEEDEGSGQPAIRRHAAEGFDDGLETLREVGGRRLRWLGGEV